MYVRMNPVVFLCVAMLADAAHVSGAKKKHQGQEEISATGPAVLWRNPADLETRNLYYGSGGKDHVPRGTFAFVKEDPGGTSPKFVVQDQHGNKWKVKLGLEAQPETAASRLVWAVGYYTDEDYFVADLKVQGMPVRLHRGKDLVAPGGIVHNARLEREPPDQSKVGTWQWRHDAFTGTRELNGLRVVMALINNWDLKDVNNAIYQEAGQRIYMVSDLGASFGSAGRSWPKERAKGNLDSYRESKFIRRVNATTVDFQAPARPRYVYLVNPKEYWQRVRMEWIGKNIPEADVRWMGRILARLSPRQIQDAFLAAGYSPDDAKGFAQVIEQRITLLTDL